MEVLYEPLVKSLVQHVKADPSENEDGTLASANDFLLIANDL